MGRDWYAGIKFSRNEGRVTIKFNIMRGLNRVGSQNLFPTGVSKARESRFKVRRTRKGVRRIEMKINLIQANSICVDGPAWIQWAKGPFLCYPTP